MGHGVGGGKRSLTECHGRDGSRLFCFQVDDKLPPGTLARRRMFAPRPPVPPIDTMLLQKVKHRHVRHRAHLRALGAQLDRMQTSPRCILRTPTQSYTAREYGTNQESMDPGTTANMQTPFPKGATYPHSPLLHGWETERLSHPTRRYDHNCNSNPRRNPTHNPSPRRRLPSLVRRLAEQGQRPVVPELCQRPVVPELCPEVGSSWPCCP